MKKKKWTLIYDNRPSELLVAVGIKPSADSLFISYSYNETIFFDDGLLKMKLGKLKSDVKILEYK